MGGFPLVRLLLSVQTVRLLLEIIETIQSRLLAPIAETATLRSDTDITWFDSVG